MTSVQPIKSLAEFEAVINSGKLVAVEFYSDQCGPSKRFVPTFVAALGLDAMKYYNANIDAVPDLASKVDIRSLPIGHAYKNGQEIDTLDIDNPSILRGAARLFGL